MAEGGSQRTPATKSDFARLEATFAKFSREQRVTNRFQNTILLTLFCGLVLALILAAIDYLSKG